MKVLKGLLYLLLAVLVFCVFITAYSTVPKHFEEAARVQTLERLEKTGTVVDEGYVETAIDNAIRSNLRTIYRTAILITLAAAFAACMLGFRPPHDCGGLNLFNPLAIPLIAVIVVSLGVGIHLALSKVQGQSVAEFRRIIDELIHYPDPTSEGDRLLMYFVIPLALEAIFRGYIFSFLEKLHFSAAIVLSTAAYALAAYYCVHSYAMRSIGSGSSAGPALFAALSIGLVFSIITWRLRSCIPALFGHVFIANSSALVEKIAAYKYVNLPLVIIVLAASLALLVFLPVLLAKRAPIFAYDYPFAEHHKRMYKSLEVKRRKRAANRSRSGAEPANRSASAAVKAGREEDELKLFSFAERGNKTGGKSSGKGSGGKKASGGKTLGKGSGGKKPSGKKSSGGKKR